MAGGRYLVYFLVPIPSAKHSPGAIQHAQYIMKQVGMKGYEKAGCKLRKYEKSRLQHALITTEEAERDRANPSQPGGPSSRGRRI